MLYGEYIGAIFLSSLLKTSKYEAWSSKIPLTAVIVHVSLEPYYGISHFTFHCPNDGPTIILAHTHLKLARLWLVQPHHSGVPSAKGEGSAFRVHALRA